MIGFVRVGSRHDLQRVYRVARKRYTMKYCRTPEYCLKICISIERTQYKSWVCTGYDNINNNNNNNNNFYFIFIYFFF